MTSPVLAGWNGDDTRIDVRMVVAPIAGTFSPAPADDVTDQGEVIAAGGLLGHVDGPGRCEPVVSFCAGFLIRFLAEPGERVRNGQPVAWLHPVDRPTTRPTPTRPPTARPTTRSAAAK